MSETREDLGAILRTLREVEQSLDRRAARAEGVNVMIWGLVGATIFGFYQLVTWNPAPYQEALGGAVNWVWVLPMVVGYAASMLVGARLGRLGVDPVRRRAFRYAFVPCLAIAAIVTALILMERYHAVYGGVTVIGGIANLAFAWPTPRSATRTTALAVGSALVLVGLAILAVPFAFASGVAALSFLFGYGLLGMVKYHLGR